MKSTIAKKTEGYGYKYTELADINKYCEENGIRYYQEVETNEINQKDYIITYLVKDNEVEKHRGCQIVEATLQGIKNKVMEYGSSLTYCRRYSLLMALGLATEDDDGASCTEEMTKEEAENYTLDFGRHKGKKLSEVGDNYIKWLLNNSSDPKVLKVIELLTGEVPKTDEEMDKELNKTQKLMKVLVEKGIDDDKVLNHYHIDSLNDLTEEQIDEMLTNWS